MLTVRVTVQALLKTANALGYHTVFCGDKPDDLIAGLADECHEIDWEDYSSLLKITADVEADGIVGVCDKAMMPVSRVSTELGLIGNSPESIEILLSKNKFRELQKKAGVFVSIHEFGELRGCIGTISAVYRNIAEEIIMNGISDSRGSQIRITEISCMSSNVVGPKLIEPRIPQMIQHGKTFSCKWKRPDSQMIRVMTT